MVEAQDPNIRYNPATAAAPATGDTLAKPERITEAVRPTASAYLGTSIIAQMPKADLSSPNGIADVSQSDYYDAIETIVLTLAEHFLTTKDVFAHSKVRHALSIIEDHHEAKLHPIATGAGIPVRDSVNVKVDSDPIPGTSTETKNPSVQPVDGSVPVSGDAQQFAPLVGNAPQNATVPVAASGPGSDAPAPTEDGVPAASEKSADGDVVQ